MGDRGNIVMKKGDSQVWFYTHWSGSEVKSTVRKALAKKWRWNDFAYLNRIVFCTLIEGDVDGETGFGIDTSLMDNEHDVVVVDVGAQRVGLCKEKAVTKDGKIPDGFKCDWTFEEFIAMAE